VTLPLLPLWGTGGILVAAALERLELLALLSILAAYYISIVLARLL
jgi:hypothetical protein